MDSELTTTLDAWPAFPRRRNAFRAPRLVLLTLVGSCASGGGSSPTPPTGMTPAAGAAGEVSADAGRAPGAGLLPFIPFSIPAPWRFPSGDRVVEAPDAMVVSNNADASAAGDAIMRAGGNAIDAAVATGFALAVTHPIAGNIGGGGFMIIRLADGRSFALDFRETAPAGATRTMFQDSAGRLTGKSRFGHLASGIPGSVAGLTEALRRFGTKSLREVMEPAIALAEHGYVVDRYFHGQIASNAVRLREAGSTIFFGAGGTPLAVGDTLRQGDLARTLRRIADKGAREFYAGETASLIVAEMERGGGIISRADLAGYTPTWREPLRGRFRGFEIVTMGPPSAGGIVLLQLLNVLDGTTPMPAVGSARYAHLLAETFRRSYIVRNTLVGDPSFVTVPLERLVSRAYADSLRRSIDPARATPSPSTLPLREGTQTTHYVTADAAGNVVSTTTTINDLFGSKVMVRGAGFLLNDEMDDFSGAPGQPNQWGLVMGETNAIQSGKRMLSSMTPTIVVGPDGRAVLAIGGAGGSRISTAVTQIVANVLAHRMSLPDAVAYPRIHHQAWPDSLLFETHGLRQAVVDSLRAMGHAIAPIDSLTNVISLMRVRGRWQGVPEPRREGAAAGH